MKKAIKQKIKSPTSANKKNTRPFSTKQMGYKENVFNNEEQHNYEKNNDNKETEKNTSGPSS